MEENVKNIPINGLEVFDSFMQRTTGRDYEPIRSGIIDIDNALGGGFVRGTLVMLGAAPGAGKTALCQWLFENMAAAGQEVIFINLEMSPDQLIARSISREIWKKEKKTITALKILRGYSWKEEERAIILRAAEEYKKSIAANLAYLPIGENAPIKNNKITEIMGAVKAICDDRKQAGKPAPLICIDYLQLVDGEERDTQESLKRVIMALKREVAIKYNTVVMCIMAQSRAANKTGEADQESGRDTSAIEYSADIMLGLTYTAIEREEECKVKKNPDKADFERERYTMKTIRLFKEAYYNDRVAAKVRSKYPEAGTAKPFEAVTLKINKDRFGCGGSVDLLFDGRHMLFKQVESEENYIQSNLAF